MAAKYILAALSIVFLLAGGLRLARDGAAAHSPSRTWLLIGGIFAAVSSWLFYRG
jgi:hypothetical protein